MSLIVSAGLPTGMEGLTYPIPFSSPETLIRIAQHAEKLGYHSVWGNDHMTTQHYVREEFPVPPRFWEPLMTYAFIAADTTTLRFGTGVLVLPMRRDIVVLAKQIATLDHFSGGRSKSASASAPIARNSMRCAGRRRASRRYGGRRRPGVKIAVRGTGDIFQVVLSQRWDFEPEVAPLDLYRSLHTWNPSPGAVYFLRFGPMQQPSSRETTETTKSGARNAAKASQRSAEIHVVGSSPEMLVRAAAAGRKLEYRPIAGTHPRGRDESEDSALEKKDALRRERTRRTRHARRPRTQRSRPCQRLRLREG